MAWKTVKNVVVFAAMLYGGLALVLFLLQGQLIYYPNLPGREYLATPDQAGLSYESVTLSTPDGVKLDAWFVLAPDARGVVLYAHGNAGNISHRLDAIKLFRDMGLSVFIFDYRGYGKSTGAPSEEGTYLDAESAWQYLTQTRGIAPARIVLFGESLGAAIAAHVAAQHQPGALVLASGFTSVPDLAADLYPFLPARWLARFRYDTRRTLQDVRAPVLVAHSREDEIIPYKHGVALYAAVQGPRQFLDLRGGHNDLFFANSDVFAQGVGDFVQRHLAQSNQPLRKQ